RVPEADPLAGLQGKSFYDPLQMPELAALRTGKAPDFEAARAALGPEVQAQQIGQNEALNAAFGGGAAGGLQAIQNAKPGTAASLGEVIAGAGAGIAQEVRRIHSENRELEELARANEGLRKRQLSSIALAEEAKKAEMSEIEAQAFNQRELTKAQMQIQISDANNRNRRPIPVTGGLFFPDTGEFMRTETETPMEILQGFLLVNEFLKSTTERTGVALGQGVMLDNLSPIVQGPVMHSIQAMNNPNIVPMFIEALEEQGREDFAANVERLFAGTPGTDSKADAALASQAVSAMAYMFLENNANPTDPPYPFLLEYQTDNFGLPGVQNTTDALSALGGLGIR
ncbi:MAG: hypothetical protein ACWGQW_22095, partial [bacterium]